MKIKELRKKYGVSQLELAMKAKISRFRLFMIEKGYAEPTQGEVEKALNFLSKLRIERKEGSNEK